MTDTTAEYYTTDRDMILILLTANLPILRNVLDDFGKTRFYFDSADATAIIDKFKKNQSLLYEASAFLRALRIFNGIVHSR